MTSAEKIAELLLSINAIAINVASPFRYSSGLLSPIYCDNRLLISHPKQRKQIISAFAESIEAHAPNFDVIAGTATAGIPHAAWLADKLDKPMLYVRSSAKSHGKNNAIEGAVTPGQTAIVIEDHISTGGSAIHATHALRDAGLTVDHCFAISTYGFNTANQAFADCACESYSLTNFESILNVASSQNVLNNDELELAKSWNKDPKGWEDLYKKSRAQ